MIVLAGASASGKTEVAKMLASKYGIVKVITTTTRDLRVGEVDGRDYFFVSKEKFQQMIEDDRFVEYTVYNNHLYGSTKDQISMNKCIVVDPAGFIDLIYNGLQRERSVPPCSPRRPSGQGEQPPGRQRHFREI